MRKLRILYLFVLLVSFSGYSQDKTALDTLTTQANGTDVAKKVRALNELCRIYTGIDNSKAMQMANEALQISFLSKDLTLVAQSKNRLGTIYDYRGILDSANLHYLDALKLFELKKDKSGVAAVYQNMGVMFYFQNDLNKAIEYYNKAIQLRTETNEPDFVAKLQNNMAVIFRQQKKYNEAIDLYNRSLAIKIKFKDREAIANAYSNLAAAYSYKQVYDSAKLYLVKALSLNEKANSSINLAGNYLQLAEILHSERKFTEAKLNVNKSINFALKAESNDILYNDYILLWNIDTMLLDYKQAVSDQYNAANYKAKIFKKEKAQAVEKMNILYETEKKDKEITTLNAEQEKKKIENRYLIIGLVLAFFILIITAIYFRQLKSKNRILSAQKKEIESKTEQLNMQAAEIARHKTQMNPHFTFNALVSIQNFILKGNKDEAVHYLTQLAKLMREMLYNSEKDFISIKEEKRFLSLYLDFEKSRFEHVFTYAFSADDSVDEENTLIPPMILQPFIENSIKHGLSPLKEKGELQIFIRKEEKNEIAYLSIEITDNGVGRKRAQEINVASTEKHQSKGVEITYSRIRSVCMSNGLDAADCFSIEDRFDTAGKICGTSVKIKLPLIENF